MDDTYVSMQSHTINSSQYFSPKNEPKNSVLMNGVQVEVVKDGDGFLNPSDRSANEWIEYDINGIAGPYNLIASVASTTGGTINVLVDGEQEEVIHVPVTEGVQNWRAVNAVIQLASPGSHKLRLVFNQNIDLNWLSVTAANLTATTRYTRSNLALNRPIFSSSKEGVGFVANLAADGNTNTRWASIWRDPQWIYVDLGAQYNISKVVLNWEAHGENYEIQVSDNASKWTSAYSTAEGRGGVETIGVTATGRYVRLFVNKRATDYGNSLFEFEVYGAKIVEPSTSNSIVNKALRKPAFSPQRKATSGMHPVPLTVVRARVGQVRFMIPNGSISIWVQCKIFSASY